jgi:hypothetical protein
MTFRVIDSHGEEDTEGPFVLTINDLNRKPSLDTAMSDYYELNVGESLTIIHTSSDPDEEDIPNLTYSMSPELGDLADGVFTYTAIAADAGDNVITFTVHDNVTHDPLTDSRSITIRVISPNIETTLEVKPEKLNTSSKGKFIAFLDMPEGRSLDEIDVARGGLLNEIPCEIKLDYDNNRIILKANRQPDNPTLYNGGNFIGKVWFTDGIELYGEDTILLIVK